MPHTRLAHPNLSAWSALALALLAVGLAGGCVNYADAPRTQTLDRLPPDLAATLQAAYPGAVVEPPVHRRQVEAQFGGYRTVAHAVQFTDGNGNPHKAEFDEAGRLSAWPMERVPALPQAAADEFFGAKSGQAPGGHVTGPVWRYRRDDAGWTYEFDYLRADSRPGHGTIGPAGSSGGG